MTGTGPSQSRPAPQTPPQAAAPGTPSAVGEVKPSQLQPLFAIGTAVTTLAAVLGTLAFSGLLARLPRNHWILATVAFSLVIAGAAFWSSAALFRSTAQLRVTTLLVRGIVVFTLGLILAVGAVFNTFSQDEKPRITARFDEQTGLSADVKVSGLASHKEIDLRVHGLRRSPDSDTEWEAFELYNAAVGPDGDGEVEHAIELPIAYGTYELLTVSAQTGGLEETDDGDQPCPVEKVARRAAFKPQGSKTGCLIFTLPRFARVPELTARLSPEKNSLAVSIAAANTPNRALLLVMSQARGKWILLHRELIMPDVSGLIDAERAVNIPGKPRRLCTLVTWYRTGDQLPPRRCPRIADNETVWTLIKV